MITKRQILSAQGGTFRILLSKGRALIIDADALPLIKLNTLKVRRSKSQYYVKIFIRSHRHRVERMLHRIIANTPPHKQCHHINGNTFDNRKANLQNLSQEDHSAETAKNRISVKKQGIPRGLQ